MWCWGQRKCQNIKYTVGKYSGQDRLFIELQWLSSPHSKLFLHWIATDRPLHNQYISVQKHENARAYLIPAQGLPDP